MVTISALWLPILLAGVAVFIASSIVHMLLPHHKTVWGTVPDEDGVMDALRRFDKLKSERAADVWGRDKGNELRSACHVIVDAGDIEPAVAGADETGRGLAHQTVTDNPVHRDRRALDQRIGEAVSRQRRHTHPRPLVLELQ